MAKRDRVLENPDMVNFRKPGCCQRDRVLANPDIAKRDRVSRFSIAGWRFEAITLTGQETSRTNHQTSQREGYNDIRMLLDHNPSA
ncbi:hypothetical protein [Flagellimonas marinaquae]